MPFGNPPPNTGVQFVCKCSYWTRETGVKRCPACAERAARKREPVDLLTHRLEPVK